MSRVLAVALGNTSIAVATVTAGGALAEVRRRPLDQLESVIEERLAAGAGARLAVCSVNPPALDRLRHVQQAAGRAPPLVAGREVPIPLETGVDEPDRVGTDRLLAALAGYRRAAGACVVVDAGTAVTVDAVDEKGTFLGGAIFPGPDLMARALAEGCAQLPRVEVRSPKGPPSAIGKDTRAAMRSGLAGALAGGVRHLVTRMQAEIGQAPVFITGGYAPVEDANDSGFTVVRDLVLEGLALAWREHRER